jgi:thymidylate kinase
MYIAIEGLKGVGKSTLLDHLKGWLELAGVDYQMLCPTRAMPHQTWWEHAAQNSQYIQDDEFRQALYAARSNYHSSQIDWSRELILGDRSIITSLVTRWEKTRRMPALNYIQQVRQQEYNISLPDHVIVLDLSDRVLLPRLAQRQRCYGKHDECLSRLQAARRAYSQIEQQADLLGLGSIRWHHVNADLTMRELTQCMGQKITQLLPQAPAVDAVSTWITRYQKSQRQHPDNIVRSILR